jgi:Tol biopolymer transport system component
MRTRLSLTIAAIAVMNAAAPLGAQASYAKPVRVSPVAANPLSGASESHDGRFFALSGDSALEVFDRTTKQWARLSEKGSGPQWSPDGRFLAYGRREAAGFRIWVLPMDPKSGKASGPERRVTIRDGRRFAWSPDGKEIAVIGMDSGWMKIWTQPFNGGDERVVARLRGGSGDAPAWSPDGKAIYFSGGPPIPSHLGYIGRVTLATGKVDSVRPFRDLIGVSADGRYLAQGNFRHETIIISSTSDGREVTRVYLPQRVSAVGWSPRGSELVGMEGPIHHEIHSVSLADGSMRKLAFGDSLYAGGPQLTHDGSQLLYTVGTRITISRPDGSGARTIKTAAEVHPSSAAWSADGSRIAYMTTDPRDLRVLDVKTGNDVRIAQLSDTYPFGNLVTDFVWRRDGRALRYSKVELRASRASVVLHEAVLGGRDSIIAVMPDSLAGPGAHFVNDTLFEKESRAGVATLDLNSGKWTVLLPKGSYGPTFSSDGSLMAYESFLPNGDDAVIKVVEGGRTRTIANPFNGEVSQLFIMPDKRNILAAVCATCLTAERRSLVLFPMNGDPPRVLSEQEGTKMMDWDNLALTPDGKTIIYDPELAWRSAVVHIPVDLTPRP